MSEVSVDGHFATRAVADYLRRELPDLHPIEGIALDIVAAIDVAARRHPDDAMPWDEFADESTLTNPRYVRRPARSQPEE